MMIVAPIMLLVGLTVAQTETPVKKKPGDIIFSHFFHVQENEIDCETCHGDIATSTENVDRNLPDMEVCADCHDVEDEEGCVICHRSPDDPQPSVHVITGFAFNHQAHVERKVACATCHAEMTSDHPVVKTAISVKAQCMQCHNNVTAESRCAACHGDRYQLADIHPTAWRHGHGEEASAREAWCASCHHEQVDCQDCHQGDNLQGNIHELNYVFIHGLDAGSKNIDCTRCHNRREFCTDCHERNLRIPLAHSTAGWLSEHGRAARQDPENCASCHETDDPSCSRSGCHADLDGIRGTDPRFHAAAMSRFDGHGAWHGDNGYVCYQCHVNTNAEGIGFCGYCHR